MRFEKVHLEGFGYALPEERVFSDQLEERVAPLYERLRLHVGRLELMSGIRERRFWPVGTRPSSVATLAAEHALERSGFDRSRIGILIHASVCRDFMEPATASVVHARLGLPPTCQAFDLSNACLGFANAMTVVAGMLERGEIEAGLVVAGEDGRPLVDETLAVLARNTEAGRADLKTAYASLTIGSGAAALVMTRADVARSSRRLIGSVALAATEHHELCSGDRAEGGGLLMETDSEALLHAGNALAARTWEAFEQETSWTRQTVDRIVTHQVGAAHRKLLLETLELDPAKDFPTVETLGNIGSVSLPISFALAEEAGFIEDGMRTSMLGIGSGLHCMMLAVQ
ncbi:MAG: 3-oxoacyl-[acyl-carrier-protein] synthase III [Planctomycetota bacterium]|jgi:3-oxoacyl-[acyl-carrier-protein] synthase III